MSQQKKTTTKRRRTSHYDMQWSRTGKNTEKRRAKHLKDNPNDKQAVKDHKKHPIQYTKGFKRIISGGEGE